MRTQDEIVLRIERLKKDDVLGFATQDLIFALNYERAKPYLNGDVDPISWKPDPIDRESLVAKMLDYMPFAWDKANNCRGISAWRSLAHFESWLWLAGDDMGDFSNYKFYGKDELRRICEHYGWDADQWDDGVRTNG